jgi:hypothetical protein
MPVNVDPKDFLHALHGLEFPASRSQIVGAAKDTGDLNGDVMLILEQLPERMYATAKDLTEEIQRTRLATNSDGDIQSAATSGISNANKGLISTMADPRRGDIEPAKRSPSPTGNKLDHEGKDQAELILARNRKLMDGTADAGPAGEAETGVGHMVNTDRSHAGGDSSND